MPRFTQDQRARIKQRLLAVASELFAARGYKDVTIDDVVAGAGIAKGTFYGFFPSKEELFTAVWEEEHEQLHERMTRLYGGLNVRDRAGLKRAVGRALQEVFDHPLLARVLNERDTPVWLRAVQDPQSLHQQEQATNTFLTELIARGQQAGLMRDGDPAHLSDLLMRLVTGLFLAGGPVGGRQLVADIQLAMDVLIDGLYRAPAEEGSPC